MPVYEATQSAIHVLVTHAFLRSLATLDLADSKVGPLRDASPARRAAAATARAARAVRQHGTPRLERAAQP